MIYDGVKIVFMNEDCDETGRVFIIMHVFDSDHIRRCWYFKDEFSAEKVVKEFRELEVDNSGDKWDKSEFIKEYGRLT